MKLESILDKLRSHELDLQAAGVKHLSVFGSWAKGDADRLSDVDIAVKLDNEMQLGLTEFGKIREMLSILLKSEIDLVSEPVRFKPRLQAEIDRDRIAAF